MNKLKRIFDTKNIAIFGMFLLLILSTFLFSACNLFGGNEEDKDKEEVKPANLLSITATINSNYKVYEGDSFDYSKVVVKAFYDDQTNKIIPNDSLSLSFRVPSLENAGRKILTVTYTENGVEVYDNVTFMVNAVYSIKGTITAQERNEKGEVITKNLDGVEVFLNDSKQSIATSDAEGKYNFTLPQQINSQNVLHFVKNGYKFADKNLQNNVFTYDIEGVLQSVYFNFIFAESTQGNFEIFDVAGASLLKEDIAEKTSILSSVPFNQKGLYVVKYNIGEVEKQFNIKFAKVLDLQVIDVPNLIEDTYKINVKYYYKDDNNNKLQGNLEGAQVYLNDGEIALGMTDAEGNFTYNIMRGIGVENYLRIEKYNYTIKNIVLNPSQTDVNIVAQYDVVYLKFTFDGKSSGMIYVKDFETNERLAGVEVISGVSFVRAPLDANKSLKYVVESEINDIKRKHLVQFTELLEMKVIDFSVDTSRTIRGHVYYTDRELSGDLVQKGLAGAKIFLNGAEVGATDEKGDFQLKYEPQLGLTDVLRIVKEDFVIRDINLSNEISNYQIQAVSQKVYFRFLLPQNSSGTIDICDSRGKLIKNITIADKFVIDENVRITENKRFIIKSNINGQSSQKTVIFNDVLGFQVVDFR